MQSHGMLSQRMTSPPTSPFQGFGRFGRLFPALYPFHPDEDQLKELGKAGGLMDEGNADPATRDNPDIPSGFTFLGQFIDHDITLDVTSSLEKQNDPDAIFNFRTAALELDNVYGQGPDNQPYLYDQTSVAKLLVDPGMAASGSNPAKARDLIRNSQGRALIGDPRNDENIILSQLQFALISFHNKVVDRLKSQGVADADLFREAQRLVRWHYQYIIVQEFLPLICGEHIVKTIRKHGRKLYVPEDYPYFQGDPYMPVEFSVAAYRYGHSQVRAKYKLNAAQPQVDVFGLLNKAFRPLTIDEVLDWKNFFVIDGSSPESSRRIDHKLASSLFNLPFIAAGDVKSLAARNLLRGKAFCLPSGQAIARFLCDRIDDAPKVYQQAELGLDAIPGLKEAPLWYYILKEADIEHNGTRLGRLGGRIVAEVILGLLELDLMSYVYLDPCWKPEFAVGGKWNMGELLKFAGVV